MKITFVSGRIEIINQAPDANESYSKPGSGLESHHNKITLQYLLKRTPIYKK